MNVTLSELLELNILEQRTIDSILKAGKLQTKTKASVIKQLELRYKIVEYVPGKKGREARFILKDPRETKLEYKPYANNGRPSIDWTDEINLFKSYIYKIGAQPLTKQTIIYRSLGLNKKEKEIINHIRKAFFNNEDLETIQTYNDMFEPESLLEKQAYKIRGAYYTLEYKFFKYRIRQLTGVLDKVLEEAQYFSTYKDSNGEDLNEFEYIEYKAFRKRVEDDLKEKGILYHRVKRMADKACYEELGYRYAFELLNFTDNKHFASAEGNQVKCKLNFYNRMKDSAWSQQERFEKGQIDVLNSGLVSVLMSKKEFSAFMTSFLDSYCFGSLEENESESKFVAKANETLNSMNKVNKRLESNGVDASEVKRKIEVFSLIA